MSYNMRNRRGSQSKFVQAFNSVSLKAKLTIAAGAIGVVGAATWALWPDRHEKLAEWNSDYMNYCHSEYGESDFSGYNSVRSRVRDSLSRLSNTGAAGQRLTDELEQNDYVFCYGDKYGEETGDIYYNRWIATYFVEWDVTDRAVTEYLFNSEIYDYVSDVMWRENEYITEHAVLWGRAKTASLQAALVDATYYIYSEPSYDQPGPFEMETWRKLESNPQTKAAAIAYRSYIESNEYPKTREARLMAFKAALQDHDAIYENEYNFLHWYKNEVDEQSRDEAYSCGTDGKDTCWRTVYEDPSFWVHSEEIHPETLVALSYAFFPDDGFIDIEDAYDILNDSANWRPTSARTQKMFNAAVRNASRYCRGHYREGDMELGTGMNMDLVQGSRFRPSME